MSNKQFDSFINKCEKVWNKMGLSQQDKAVVTQSLKDQWWRFDIPLSSVRQRHIRNATLLFLANYHGEK